MEQVRIGVRSRLSEMSCVISMFDFLDIYSLLEYKKVKLRTLNT